MEKLTEIVLKTRQQGDLLLRRLDTMPEGEARTVSKSKLVLAHGESGHTHIVEDSNAELIQIGERMLMKMETPPYSGPLRKCSLVSENESQFFCDTELGRVAFAKSEAKFESGTVKVGPFGLVRHEEHFHQALSPGIWEIGRVREYDWFNQMTRRVMD